MCASLYTKKDVLNLTKIHIERMEEDKIADTGNKMASLLYSQKYVETLSLFLILSQMPTSQNRQVWQGGSNQLQDL